LIDFPNKKTSRSCLQDNKIKIKKMKKNVDAYEDDINTKANAYKDEA